MTHRHVPPRLAPFLIACRHASAPWERTPVVEQAKAAYDAGLVEICTGRDFDTFFLYAIPRRKPGRPRRYFLAPSDDAA